MAAASEPEDRRTSTPDRKGVWLRAASFAALLLIWQLAALLAGSDLLPLPLAVGQRLLKELASGELVFHTAVTLGRVGLSFVIAMVLGTVIGLAMGRRRGLDAGFDGWLTIGLNIPALVTTILCFVWFGLNEVSAILAVVINKMPTVIVIMREGARALDHDLAQVARLYRLPATRTLRRVVLPQLTPYLMGAARTGLALIWKIVLVVELLGRSNGVGFQLSVFFQFFDITGILAYTLVFAGIIVAIEGWIMRPLERRATRWRPGAC